VARAYGVSRSTVERWTQTSLDVTALAERHALRRRLREQARANGVPDSTRRNRIRARWSPERAVIRRAERAAA
jgi:hypothetical protein